MDGDGDGKGAFIPWHELVGLHNDMIQKFDGRGKLLFFPKKWANAVVMWLSGVYSPNGTISVNNTLNPTDDGSLGLDVNLDAVTKEVLERVDARYLTHNEITRIRDVIRGCIDDASIKWTDENIGVNMEWLVEQVLTLVGTSDNKPVITASKSGKTTTIYADGTAIATIEDGEDGEDGSDGTTPTLEITSRVSGDNTLVYANGNLIATLGNGEDGKEISSVISGTDSDGQPTLTFYYNDNTHYGPVSLTTRSIASVTDSTADNGDITFVVNFSDGTTSDGATMRAPSFAAYPIDGGNVITVNGVDLCEVMDGEVTIEYADAHYAAIDHNHDETYSKLGHGHNYAALDHNHDSVYSKLGHEHSDYANQTAFSNLAAEFHNFQAVVEADYVTADSLETTLSSYSNSEDIASTYATISDVSAIETDISDISLWADGIDADIDELATLCESFLTDDDLSGYATQEWANGQFLLKTNVGKSGGAAAYSHNHDSVYSKLGHTHSYAASNHNHDSVYSKLGHNHDSSYANKTAFSNLQAKVEEIQTTLDDCVTTDSLETTLSSYSNTDTIASTYATQTEVDGINSDLDELILECENFAELGSVVASDIGTTASAGTSEYAARADHVHKLPPPSASGATNLGGGVTTGKTNHGTTAGTVGTNCKGFSFMVCTTAANGSAVSRLYFRQITVGNDGRIVGIGAAGGSIDICTDV